MMITTEARGRVAGGGAERLHRFRHSCAATSRGGKVGQQNSSPHSHYLVFNYAGYNAANSWKPDQFSVGLMGWIEVEMSSPEETEESEPSQILKGFYHPAKGCA